MSSILKRIKQFRKLSLTVSQKVELDLIVEAWNNETDTESFIIYQLNKFENHLNVLKTIERILVKGAKTTTIISKDFHVDNLNNRMIYSLTVDMTSGFDEWINKELNESGIIMSTLYPRPSGFRMLFRMEKEITGISHY